MSMKRNIRLTEQELKRIIGESVRTIIREHGYGNDLDKRDEWKNFQDPLVRKSNEMKSKSNLKRNKKLFNNIVAIEKSEWMRLLEKNNVQHSYHMVSYVNEEDDSRYNYADEIEFATKEEALLFMVENKELMVRGFVYFDFENAPKNPMISSLESVVTDFFNIEQYDEIEADFRRQGNSKRVRKGMAL